MVSRQNHVSSASLIVRPGQCWKRAPGSNSSKYLPKAITYLRALANTDNRSSVSQKISHHALFIIWSQHRVISEADQPWRGSAELSAPLLHPPFGHRQDPQNRRRES